MTSPDILDQNPHFTQSYNRFAYVMNNPMKFTDPSGYVSYGATLGNLYDPMYGLHYYGQMARITESGYTKDYFKDLEAFWALFGNDETKIGGGGSDNQDGGNTGDKINEANSLTSPYTAWFGFVGNAAKNELKLYKLPGFGLKSMSSIGSKIGFAGSSFSLLTSASNIYNTEGSWGSYMQLSFSLGMIGLNFVPAGGPFLAFGLSTYDAGGGFQSFYNGMNEYQKFYNLTHIIMLPPLNPSMIPIFLNFGAN